MHDHELPAAFAAHGLPLHATLTEMLNEHHSHRTERRGCGYTQSTRFLADLINVPTLPDISGLGLFDRNSRRSASELRKEFLAQRDAIGAALTLPESRLLLDLICDMADTDRSGESPFLVAAEKLKVGSCPLAEQYFLEIAHGRVRRRGRVNVIVDADGAPCMLEKRGLGDEHSCISVSSLRWHGVRLPPGSLLALDYDDEAIAEAPQLTAFPGQRLQFSHIRSGRFLRLTTLAVAPVDRARAFSAHFQQQVAGGLFSPDSTTIEQLMQVAKQCLA